MDNMISFKCFLSGICIPYSKQACEDAADKLGLKKGGAEKEFTSSDDPIKGCYAFVSEDPQKGNEAYYGSGGTADEMNAPLAYPMYRPSGHNCSTVGQYEASMFFFEY